MPEHPTIALTADVMPVNGSLRAVSTMACADAIACAGGTPIILPPIPERIDQFAARCDAIVLTGGDDPRTEPFGQPTDPRTTPIHPRRQAFESDLIRRLAEHRPDLPVLGICLGMQLMALHAGGRLDQHLPETLPGAERHWDRTHPVHAEPETAPSDILPPLAGVVFSRHRQAVADPGTLRVIARSDDALIEAIADPKRRFYVGLQWHPERTDDPAVGSLLWERLVAAARSTSR